MTTQHLYKGPFVRELTLGERVTGYYLLQRKQLEPFRDRSKGNFLTLILSDRTGQILARVWDDAPSVDEALNEGDVIKVQGDVEEYLGRTQVIVHKVRTAQPNEFSLADFLPATEKDLAGLWAQVEGVIASLQEPHLAALVRAFYSDDNFRAQFEQAPAARRVHHAYLGGLLEHLGEVLSVCASVLALYPTLNADLLYTGALLHDVGKLREYTWAREIDYTDEGRLVGHITVSTEMVNTAITAIPDFPAELRLRVLHMLVSHHGRYEWGSPRRPQTLEAIALHHITELSAQLNRFNTLLLTRRSADQAWTEYDRLLGRQLYVGTGDELNAEESGQLE